MSIQAGGQRAFVESLGNFTDLALGELKAWLDPWYQPRGGSSITALSTYAVRRSSLQSVPAGAETTVILNALTRSFNPGGMFSLNTVTGVLTVGQAGTYMVSAFMAWSGGDMTGDRLGFITDTAGEIARSYTPGGYQNVSVSAAANLSAGDTLTLSAFQSSAGTLSLTSAMMTVVRVS